MYRNWPRPAAGAVSAAAAARCRPTAASSRNPPPGPVPGPVPAPGPAGLTRAMATAAAATAARPPVSASRGSVIRAPSRPRPAPARFGSAAVLSTRALVRASRAASGGGTAAQKSSSCFISFIGESPLGRRPGPGRRSPRASAGAPAAAGTRSSRWARRGPPPPPGSPGRWRSAAGRRGRPTAARRSRRRARGWRLSPDAPHPVPGPRCSHQALAGGLPAGLTAGLTAGLASGQQAGEGGAQVFQALGPDLLSPLGLDRDGGGLDVVVELAAARGQPDQAGARRVGVALDVSALLQVADQVVDGRAAHARAGRERGRALAVGPRVLEHGQVLGAHVGVALLGEGEVNAVAHLLPQHAHHRRDRLALGLARD